VTDDLARLREAAAGGDRAAEDQLVEQAVESGDLDELRRLAAPATATRSTSSSSRPGNGRTSRNCAASPIKEAAAPGPSLANWSATTRHRVGGLLRDLLDDGDPVVLGEEPR
jgi:hypothetical protein